MRSLLFQSNPIVPVAGIPFLKLRLTEVTINLVRLTSVVALGLFVTLVDASHPLPAIVVLYRHCNQPVISAYDL